MAATLELVFLVPALVAHELHGHGADVHRDHSLEAVVVHLLGQPRDAAARVQDQVGLPQRCRQRVLDADPALVPVEVVLHPGVTSLPVLFFAVQIHFNFSSTSYIF